MVLTRPEFAPLIADRQRAQSRLEEVRELLLPLQLEQARLEGEIRTHDKYLAKIASTPTAIIAEEYGALTSRIVAFVSAAGTDGVSAREVNRKFGKSARSTVQRLCKNGVLLLKPGRILVALKS